MPGPFDWEAYKPCCGRPPRFTKDAGIWFAICFQCGEIASAMDGSAQWLAKAWNERIERKDGGKQE